MLCNTLLQHPIASKLVDQIPFLLFEAIAKIIIRLQYLEIIWLLNILFKTAFSWLMFNQHTHTHHEQRQKEKNWMHACRRDRMGVDSFLFGLLGRNLALPFIYHERLCAIALWLFYLSRCFQSIGVRSVRDAILRIYYFFLAIVIWNACRGDSRYIIAYRAHV